jgi:hypothetical protein
MLGSIGLYAALPLLLPGSELPPPAPIPFILSAAAAMVGLTSFALPQVIARVPAKDAAEAEARAFQAKIIQWALDELIGVLGLVLYVMGAGTTWLWGLCAVAALLLGMHGPREAAAPSDSRDLARPDVKIG